MKIGVLGGTFDPVHNGHLYMAKHCIKMLELDKIMFLPNGNPPHKREQNVTDKSHRYNMICIAIEGEENFYVSDYEINREDYSYTVETMRYMRKSSDDEYVMTNFPWGILTEKHREQKISAFMWNTREGNWRFDKKSS